MLGVRGFPYVFLLFLNTSGQVDINPTRDPISDFVDKITTIFWIMQIERMVFYRLGNLRLKYKCPRVLFAGGNIVCGCVMVLPAMEDGR